CKGQQNQVESTTEQKEISEVWEQLVATISDKNTVRFKELSGPTINCYDCLENTPKKKTEMYQLRQNDPNWYDRIYDVLIYVPIAEFISEDFDLIFTSEFVEILKVKKCRIVTYPLDEVLKYEVLVTTLEPSENYEGMQHAFEFEKYGGVWKFVRMSTIP
ncbi:unnamed protein product, partial [Ectocarpus sp. 12 AP-2014]